MRKELESTAKALSIMAALALIAAVSIPVAATAYAQPKPREAFTAVNDIDGTALYDTQEHERQKRHAQAVIAAVREIDAEAAETAQEQAFEPETYNEPSYTETAACSAPGDLRTNGVESDGEHVYTWYSENVLPGGGLEIPGRHVDDDGYVVDGDGNICVASSDLPQGTVIETPYGTGVVYDTGCASGVVDVYTAW